MNRINPFSIFLKVLIILYAAYIVLPLIAMIVFSFSGKIEVIPSSLTLKWYTFNLGDMLQSILNSLIISMPAVLISLVFSLPLSYAIARKNFPGKKVIDSIIVLPILIPGTVLGLSILQMVNTNLFAGVPPLLFLIFAHVVVVTPVLSRPIIAALQQTGITLEEASKTLGAGSLMTFMKITFPIVMPSIFVGMIFGFARSITDFIITLFLVTAGFIPMSIKIFNSTQYSIPQITSANAVVLLILSLITVSIAEIIAKKATT